MVKKASEKSMASGAVDLAKVVLYAEDTFDKANPTPQQLQAMKNSAVDIGNSGFGTVILAFLHIHSDGTFYYNDIPFDETLSFLPEMVATMKEPGNVSGVLLSIGPNAGDYQNIKNNVSRFKQNFASLVAQVGLNGIDFDLEQNYEDYGDLLVDLVGWAANEGMTVTAAPYTEQNFWIDLLKQTSTSEGNQFAWWNLQTYGGADYLSWVNLISGLVPNPESFIVPGYSVQYSTTPDSLQRTLQGLQASYPSLSGSFVWQYELINSNGYTASEFASAIQAGLGGNRRKKHF